jgi:cellulose synthase/poly-beta-1,6-N-acetylglucosamine synthase-like glycosyltransferase
MVVAIRFYRDGSLFGADHDPDCKECHETPLVSCIVAVHNEETLIQQCVRSLLGQRYPNTEVIFVDDASTDRTPDILRSLSERENFRVIFLDKNVGKKRALSAAVLECKGEIIAFSDSDSLWAPDAVEKVVRVFAHDQSVGAVSGHCRALNANSTIWTRIQDSWYEGQFSIRKAFESHFGAVTCVSGPMAVFRKQAIYNYMPAWEQDRFLGQEFRFATDRTLTGFVLGGAYIGKKLKLRYPESPFSEPDYPARPWRVVYCKAARAWTEVPDSFRRVITQQVRWKKSFFRNLFFTGSFYWRRPVIPAAVYYLHIAFVLLGPLVAFRHLIYLPLHGNIAALFLYVFGIVLVGSMFGLALLREDREERGWIYRPLMSLLSTLVLSWLVFYSIATIKRMKWVRG